MAHPPPSCRIKVLKGSKGFVYPTMRSWPMGFANSCTIAQAVSDVCCLRASLPTSQRIRMHDSPPLRPPCWASIVDDIWVLHQGAEQTDSPTVSPQLSRRKRSRKEVVGGVQSAETVTPGDFWLGFVEREWRKVNLESHPKKVVDNACDFEVQGGMVEAKTHHFGLSVAKRDLLCRSTL